MELPLQDGVEGEPDHAPLGWQTRRPEPETKEPGCGHWSVATVPTVRAAVSNAPLSSCGSAGQKSSMGGHECGVLCHWPSEWHVTGLAPDD